MPTYLIHRDLLLLGMETAVLSSLSVIVSIISVG